MKEGEGRSGTVIQGGGSGRRLRKKAGEVERNEARKDRRGNG